MVFFLPQTFEPDATLVNQVFPKSEETKTILFDALLGHFLFETLLEKELTQIVDCMKPMTATAGEIIIQQGDVGDLFYCLQSGTVTASVDSETDVMTYKAGACFGELALLYNCPRAASVVARSSASLWTLDLK